ncbi:MAG: hypothetical protein IJU76_14310 [Desulfovibrionaceae bacterium]|nr:hypothetical protein [Desulfovibrionaceae bacterium]
MGIETSAFEKQQQDIALRASDMKKRLVDPFRNDDGSIDIKDAKTQGQILESTIKGSIYESVQDGAMIAAVHSRALRLYELKHGRMPEDDLLASCSKAVENALLLGSGKVHLKGIYEAAEMSTTDGVIMRNRLVSLVLPVMLQMITSSMVTFIPGEFNQSEFFRIKRVAGSNFGDLQKGDIIDWMYNGVYSAMDQRAALGTGDGSTVKFTFDSAAKFGTAYPFKSKRTRIYVDRKLVAEDNGNGAMIGSYEVGGSTVTITGTVDEPTGHVEVTFSAAPTANAELIIGFDVDIEKDPTLIPRVDHKMWSKTLYPHEGAINGNATIQALWALRRELGQDIDNLTMQGLRNLLAADKDKKHLRDMMFHCTNVVEWDRTVPTSLTKFQHYESVVLALLEVDSLLRIQNGVSGLVGMVGGTQAVNMFRSMKSDVFVAAPGFRSEAQPHYVGRLYGQWDLFCDPLMDTNTLLCYAKGPDHGQTAYVVGDAVPALTFRHPVLGDLVQKATMWELAYRDMQPFDGEKYLCKLVFTESN